MKIQIIGYGIVGSAQEYLCKKLGHCVTVYDPYVEPESTLSRDVDVTFICTPEKVVEEVIHNLLGEKVEGLYVIKSTVPPGTTERLMKENDVHLCHNPEFLREKTAFEDALNPDRVIIGQCCKRHGQVLVNLYSPMHKPIYLTNPTTSEITKLTSNIYLGTLITFWNEIAEIAKKLDLNAKEIARLVTADHRMSKYGTEKFGEPFSGTCLPKDTIQMISTFHGVGLNPLLFEAIQKFNDKLTEETR